MLVKKSVEHLKENNMGYFEHLLFAASHGIRCIKAGVLLMFHSLIPACFPKTGSILVEKLNQSFTDHKDWIDLKNKIQKFDMDIQ